MNESAAQLLDFKRKDAASYDDVTDAFDRCTERFTGAIAAHLVASARLQPDERVLDVGAGTGVVTFAAAPRLSAAGRLVGIDLSEGMLAKAREKAARAGNTGTIAFLRMDAEALTFPDAEFDCVLSLFALRHFPRPDLALAQIRRVLRTGGRAVIAVGSAPPLVSREGVLAGIRLIRRALNGLRGRRDLIACAYLDGLVEKHVPITESEEVAAWTKHRAMQSSVPRMMAGAGFTDIRVTWAGHDGIVESGDEFWDVQVTFSSLARKRLATAAPEAVERLRREFDEGCARAQASGGRLRYPTGALIVTGTAGGSP